MAEERQSSNAGNGAAGPLAGYRILDLTTMLSGPWATMLLGDQGADVIKVEVPETGDHTRSLGNRRGGMSSMYLNINRSKRSITIDLKNPAGRDLLRDLARSADVFVQNFRPGVVDRLGVGEAHIRNAKPDIVYVSISGFGDSGPYAGKPVYDPIIQALSGLTTVQAGSDDARPRLIRTVLPDKLSAVFVSQSITAALLARERSGEGQHVKLSMIDAMMAFLWASDMGAQTFVDQPVSHQEAASFIDLIYETRDGYVTAAVMRDKEWEALTRALDRPEWAADPRFATPSARDAHVNERLELTQREIAGYTTDEIMARLEREGVPCARALRRSEVIEDPQIVANDILLEFEHPSAGRLRQTGTPARFLNTPAAIERGAPRLGEHTDQVLAECGFSAARIAELREAAVVGPERYSEPSQPCWSSRSAAA
ncbi:MAG: CoA transferase [Gammaproteobacteria bacterium]|nr:CoA transferase [Gammaproteobacteria bacterium]